MRTMSGETERLASVASVKAAIKAILNGKVEAVTVVIGGRMFTIHEVKR